MFEVHIDASIHYYIRTLLFDVNNMLFAGFVCIRCGVLCSRGRVLFDSHHMLYHRLRHQRPESVYKPN